MKHRIRGCSTDSLYSPRRHSSTVRIISSLPIGMSRSLQLHSGHSSTPSTSRNSVRNARHFALSLRDDIPTLQSATHARFSSTHSLRAPHPPDGGLLDTETRPFVVSLSNHQRPPTSSGGTVTRKPPVPLGVKATMAQRRETYEDLTRYDNVACNWAT